MVIYFFVKFQMDPLYDFRLTCFAPNYHGNGRHFEFFQPPKAATRSGYFYKVSWNLMKGIQVFFKSPLFCFHGNCNKVCPTDSDLFVLSRSTRCGCCSYRVSSIYVRGVTCYDHFCGFFLFFLAFRPFPWQRQPFWKKSTLSCTTSHGIWYSYKVS